jgi:hypothetical protein
MTAAAELLAQLRARGIDFAVREDRLCWCPRGAVTSAEVAALATHKAEVLALLAPTTMTPGDWLEVWRERAAIMEEGGHLARDEADALALADTVRRMNETPVGSPCQNEGGEDAPF